MSKSLHLVVLCCVCPLISSTARASEDVLLVSVGKTKVSGQEKVQWLLGGGTRDLAVSFLQKNTKHPVVADLLLSGARRDAVSRLLEPLAKEIPFHRDTQEGFPSLQSGTFSLELPKVEKTVRMILLLRTHPPDGGQGRGIAAIPLLVCPDTVFEKISKQFSEEATAGHARTLAVFGDMQGLRELLRLGKVPYEDLGGEFPVRIAPGTVAVGELPETLPLPSLSMAPGSSLIIFHPDPESPEEISTIVQDRSVRMVVHQAPPASWSNDAKAQLLLHDIIQKTPAIP
jgi:hypothetical protein